MTESVTAFPCGQIQQAFIRETHAVCQIQRPQRHTASFKQQSATEPYKYSYFCHYACVL